MQSKMVEVGLGPFQEMIEIRLKDKPNTNEQLFLNKYLFSCQCLCECLCKASPVDHGLAWSLQLQKRCQITGS